MDTSLQGKSNRPGQRYGTVIPKTQKEALKLTTSILKWNRLIENNVLPIQNIIVIIQFLLCSIKADLYNPHSCTQ